MKKIYLVYVLPLLASLYVGCSSDPIEDIPTAPGEGTLADLSIELAHPENGTVSEVYFAGLKVPVEVHNGTYIYQGDIMLPQSLVSSEPARIYEKGETPASGPNKSVGRTSGKWPGNVVYYSIATNLENQERVHKAIAHWEENTNLTFTPRSSQENYIHFESGEGCSSFVGMVGGKQKITLSSKCSTGNTIHEIGHAIGLWHEHSRVDRSDYIIVKYDNIEEGKEHNFKTYAERMRDGAEYTSTLDFNSIMMYGSYSFSHNGLPTLVTRDGSTFRIQRSSLSDGDRSGVNRMYPHSSGGAPLEETYENGKYYIIAEILVYRMHDRWYFYSESGWREVQLEKDHWFYA